MAARYKFLNPNYRLSGEPLEEMPRAERKQAVMVKRTPAFVARSARRVTAADQVFSKGMDILDDGGMRISIRADLHNLPERDDPWETWEFTAAEIEAREGGRRVDAEVMA